MTSLLDLVNPEEFLALLVLIILLVFVGQQMVKPNSLTYQQARRLAATVIVLYCAGGIFAWEPSGAGDLLLIVVRALFAAGFVFGASTLLLALVHHLVGDPVTAIVTKYREWTVESRQRVALERERRETAARQRRQRAEDARLAAEQERERRRWSEEEAVSERERLARIEDARNEVVRFFDQHAPALAESLPPALFRSQLETRFPDAVTPEEAWRSAQEMIVEMLPLIAQGRERARTVEERTRERDREVQRLRRDIRKLEKEIKTIQDSPTFDPDVGAPEILALREQIDELREELEAVQDRPVETQS